MRENVFLKKIGDNIARIRANGGLSLTELGNMCGIKKSNLIPIEKGRQNITLLTLYKIAGALGVQVKEIFEFEEEKHQNTVPPPSDRNSSLNKALL